MAEKECIEREAAIEAVKKERDYTGKFTFEEEHGWAVGFQQGITFAISDIAAIPAADVRPVVLCRDCKFAPIGDKDGSDLEWPFNEFDENPCPYKCLDNWYSHKPAPDFFCAAGEKREES